MKSNQISIIVASLILGISFIVGCSLINNGRGLEPEQEQALAIASADKPLLTIEETALFLNLTEDQVMEIIKTEHKKLSDTGSFPGTMFPYIRVDSEYLFNKDLLMTWINEASLAGSVYLNGQRTDKWIP